MWKKSTNMDDVTDSLTESSVVLSENSLKEQVVDDEVDEINKLLTSNQLSNWDEAVFLASGERLVGSLNTDNEVYLYGKVEGESLEKKRFFYSFYWTSVIKY